MRRCAILLGLAALLAATPSTAATTINFDSYVGGFQPNPLVDGNATFSGPSGLFVGNLLFDGNNQICSTDGPFCDLTLDVDFASAVSGLSFLVASDDSQSTLSILLTLADLSTTLATFEPDGNIYSYDLVDLSAYGNVLGISLSSDDVYGLTYDNFTFADAIDPVPEPATWLMLILGFGIVGSALRRRRHAGAALA